MAWLVIGGLILFGIVCITLGWPIDPDKPKKRTPAKKPVAYQAPGRTPKAKAYASYMNDIHGEDISREAFDALLKPFREQVADFKKRTKRITSRVEKAPYNKPIDPEILAVAKAILAEIRECDGKLDAFERSIYCETEGGHNKIIQIMENLHEVESDLENCICEIENFEPDE